MRWGKASTARGPYAARPPFATHASSQTGRWSREDRETREAEVASLLGAGIGIMIVADAVVGTQLLRLFLRTRRLPELLLGSAFLLLGAVGYPLSIAARRLAAESASAEALLGAALSVQNLACAAVWLFTWLCFRRASRVAGLWAGVGIAALGAHVLAELLGLDARGWDGGWAYGIGFAGRAGAFAWATLESALCYRRLRRQRALGIADPVVVDRMLLWTLANAAPSVAFAVFLGGRLASVDVATAPIVLAPTSVLGVIAGVCIWLAFVPPRAYLARVTARGAAERSRIQ